MTIISMCPSVRPQDERTEGAQNLAWEHASGIAEINGYTVGDDNFVTAYRTVLERYTVCSDHSAFIQHTAFRVLQSMLQSRYVAVVIPPEAQVADVTERIEYLGDIICSALMWSYASYPNGWVSDAMWEEMDAEDNGVDFMFNLETVPEVTEDDGRA